MTLFRDVLYTLWGRGSWGDVGCWGEVRVEVEVEAVD